MNIKFAFAVNNNGLFQKNIKLINAHFIPVIVSEENPESIIEILMRHIKNINEELKNKSVEYMLFTIKNGVMKPAGKKLDK